MDNIHLDFFRDRYDAIIFDVGNTLVVQNNFGTSREQLQVDLLPGVRELMNKLTNYFKLALVSNTTELNSQDILNLLSRVDIAKYFEVCIASSEIGVHKPSPEPIIHALRELKIVPAKALYVGDVEIDQLSATAAGVDFLFTQVDITNAFIQFAKAPECALARAKISPVKFDLDIRNQALTKFDELVKPQKSLGQLEEVTAQICAITGHINPQIDPVAIAVFAADHGIAESDDVTPWPQSITGLMTDLIINRKAAISVISEVNDIFLQVVNVGTIGENLNKLVKDKRISSGTADYRFKSAMTLDQAQSAMDVGADTAERLVASGSRTLCCGEVGIGNTTSSAILIGHFTKKSAEEVTGFGSGIDKATFDRKFIVVDKQITKLANFYEPELVLAEVGGFEIAALVGYILRGATLQVPVVLDGVITLAAALVACAIKPEIKSSLIAGHCSLEPGARVALEFLDLRPILNMDLRLGEGTGAALAIPILRSGCATLIRMGHLKDFL